jgi:5'-3' exonuclease
MGKTEVEDYTIEKINKEYGLEPLDLIEVKGLMGDPSDNIPGVPGVGEKTALNLIKEYKNIDGVYENIDKQKGKLKERQIIKYNKKEENEEDPLFGSSNRPHTGKLQQGGTAGSSRNRREQAQHRTAHRIRAA